MRISWNWLLTLIETDLTPQQAAEVLTSTGLEVESVERIEPVKGMLEGVVVGEVVECRKHPDADRLSVCQVNVAGGAPLQIVCGAPNVAAGQKVLVATVGTTLHPIAGEAPAIKRSRIRGVESQGMICAEDELGIGESHAGILVLENSARAGTPAAEQLGMVADHVFEIGLTPNRADAMSHIGVARDLAAAVLVRGLGKALVHWPSVDTFTPAPDRTGVQVEVKAAAACPRYAGLTLENVKVGPSPSWLQDRLRSIGAKPINNVVDVTNYVQHEIGQPLHAFDADQLVGRRVVVRMAAEGEVFTTLDGMERKLTANDLVIADAEKPACLAGVFGGLHSGVTNATTTVFLESACFDATTIRRTARRQGLNTDASFRFERGVDPERTVYALQRAALLLQMVTGARISSGTTDLVASTPAWRNVTLRHDRLNTLLGTPVQADELERVLLALDCHVIGRENGRSIIDVPPYRVDVTREADLIEEVVRIIGFDRVPLPGRLQVPSAQQQAVPLEGLQRRTATHLASRGFHEVMTPSLVGGERTLRSMPELEGTVVRLKNPLSAELDVMRPTMLFGLLQSAAHNIARQQKDVRLFEFGRVYRSGGDRIDESERLALLMTGANGVESWRSKSAVSTLEDMAAEVELLLERSNIGSVVGPSERTLLRDAAERKSGKVLFAEWGQVRTSVLQAFDIAQPVFYAELYLEAIRKDLSGRKTAFAPVPRFPAVRRDLSLLIDRTVSFAELERVARQSERKLLREVGLFDVYEGDKLPAGKKSYALSFVLLDDEKTLTDEQVEKAMGRIRQGMEKELGAQLRG